MSEHYHSIVEQNQYNLKYFRERSNKIEFDQKITASYDMAVARMNTVLLKLIQHPLVALDLDIEVDRCQQSLNKFYEYTKKYDDSKWFKWYYKICLHNIGEKEIPYVKSLLNTVKAKTSD